MAFTAKQGLNLGSQMAKDFGNQGKDSDGESGGYAMTGLSKELLDKIKSRKKGGKMADTDVSKYDSDKGMPT